MSPQERWKNLKQRLIHEIDAIDKDTPWSDAGEPKWWLEMMDVQKLVIHQDLDNAKEKQ